MSDSDDENYVLFGTPLDPLDEENLPRKRAITIEEQYACDDQGRRRFHGAFTGGFSAGYFNTVGTRDGWKPQQFKSSRSSKAENVTQCPEDFMDEEDTGEFGIAPMGIRATSDYTNHGKKGSKRERAVQQDGPIPGVPVLQELLKPVKDTVGVTLLKKMGWKPGQGIGPRVTKKEKKRIKEQNEKIKIYGCSLPSQEERMVPGDSEDSDDDNCDVTFAPDDYEPFRCNPKDNYFGIGYTGLDRRPVLSGHINLFDAPAFSIHDKNKKLSIKGQAFGVGAFEADDEDIYAKDDMSRYDFAIGPERKTKSRWSQEESSSNGRDKCIEGFVAAKNSVTRIKVFKPPELPKDFKPIHVVRKSRFYPPIEVPKTALENGKRMGLARHELTAQDRAKILDDSNVLEKKPHAQSITSNSSSVASNIISRTLNLHGREQTKLREESQQSKAASWLDKLNVTSFVKGGVVGTELTGALKNLEDYKDSMSSASASISEGESGKKEPTKAVFADAEKQQRFEKFLFLSKRGEKEKLLELQPLSMTEWDREHERMDFEQAARLYATPKDIASRFAVAGEAEAEEEDDSPESQLKKAAELKMFGKLTRERAEWKPSSIVCKRFNIPEPKTGCADPSKEKKSAKFSVFDSLDWCGPSKFQRATESVPESMGNRERVRFEIRKDSTKTSTSLVEIENPLGEEEIPPKRSEKLRIFESSYEQVFGKEVNPPQESVGSAAGGKGEEDEQKSKETEESSSLVSKPEKKDLFKAIFLSSSEDESESEVEENVDTELVKSVLIGQNPAEVNSQRNTSPPRGIFAKLDLDNLVASRKEEQIELKDQETPSKDPIEEVAADPELPPDMYGPILPSKSVTKVEESNAERDSSKPVLKSMAKMDTSIGKWVEKTKVKKSKKEKKKHKHKERSKHKRKSKKEKR